MNQFVGNIENEDIYSALLFRINLNLNLLTSSSSNFAFLAKFIFSLNNHCRQLSGKEREDVKVDVIPQLKFINKMKHNFLIFFYFMVNEYEVSCDGMKGYLTPCLGETNPPIFRSPAKGMEDILNKKSCEITDLDQSCVSFSSSSLEILSICILVTFAISDTHATPYAEIMIWLSRRRIFSSGVWSESEHYGVNIRNFLNDCFEDRINTTSKEEDIYSALLFRINLNLNLLTSSSSNFAFLAKFIFSLNNHCRQLSGKEREDVKVDVIPQLKFINKMKHNFLIFFYFMVNEYEVSCDGMKGYLTPCLGETNPPIFRSPAKGMEDILNKKSCEITDLDQSCVSFSSSSLEILSICILVTFAISDTHATPYAEIMIWLSRRRIFSSGVWSESEHYGVNIRNFLNDCFEDRINTTSKGMGIIILYNKVGLSLSLRCPHQQEGMGIFFHVAT
ncbi:hypothetical protein YC2023_067311 [Brassica napus]